MAYVLSKEKRSQIMQRVKSSGNKSAEEKLILYFSERNITEWRRHYNVKGYHDFVFLDKHIAIFVMGAFGMDTIAETLALQITLITGTGKGKRTRSMMLLLHSLFRIAVGLLSAYGNAN